MTALLLTLLLVAQPGTQPTIYIAPTEDNFEVFIAAAMTKKKVPVRVTKNPESADFILTTTGVEIQQQSTGSKVVRCLFAYCAGIEDRGVTSVEVTEGDVVVWSYSVNKGRGQKNRQSLAEAIAKHFKDDFLKKRYARK
jgi:hypothetical protein